MRLKLFLLLALLLNFFSAYTQSLKDKPFLDVTIGPSFPLGVYAKKEMVNSASGFANTGAAINISYTRLVSKNFGLSVALHGQDNPLNTKALANALGQVTFSEGVYGSSGTQSGPPPTYPSYKYSNWTFDKHAWLLGSLLLGGYGQVSPKSSGNLVLTAKAMAGLAYAHAPEINGESTSDTAAAQLTQSSGASLGIAYSLTGGIKFRVSNKIHLLTQAEYLGTSKIMFKDINTSFSSVHYTNGMQATASGGSSAVNVKQTITSLNLTVGIEIIL